ncbi:hypothetical protein C8R44DRAFT_723515 [Mycena epipterygia]|nr:hypothetical protein C8R44DRAFT_723515 [Mycena epipterygia]
MHDRYEDVPIAKIYSRLCLSPISRDIAQAEHEVDATLSQLQATGIFRAANCLNIDKLLNIAEEQTTINDGTDQEICDAVREKRAEEQLLEIEGGDDHDFSNDVPKAPSHRGDRL